ncbi:MAG: hypothetical protein HKN39_05195 [Flavobacteriales bacterium]|nr:hypothetical protein [Flavobacteriales bacterium]
MKHFLAFFLALFIAIGSFSQVPSLQVEDASGSLFDLPDLFQNDTNYGIVIWSAQDPPSIGAFDDYNTYYNTWNSTYNVEFIIINIDDALPQQDVIDFYENHGWTYELYFASSTETLQAFDINSIPYIYLVNMDQQIVFEVAGWLQGNLLGEEISQMFTVGLGDIGSANIDAFSNENILFLNFDQVYSNISIELFSLQGKRTFQRSFASVSPGDKMLQFGNNSNERISTLVIRSGIDVLVTKKVFLSAK